VAADPWSWSAVRRSRSRAHGPRSAVIGPQTEVPLRLLGYLDQRNGTAGQRNATAVRGPRTSWRAFDVLEGVMFADRSHGRLLTLCSHLLFSCTINPLITINDLRNHLSHAPLALSQSSRRQTGRLETLPIDGRLSLQ
jgi:hypothetical protein